jgi:hypothetical protein
LQRVLCVSPCDLNRPSAGEFHFARSFDCGTAVSSCGSGSAKSAPSAASAAVRSG